MFLINSLNVGGAERSLVELVPVLRGAGFDVLIGCLKPTNGPLAAEARASGGEVIEFRSSSWLGWFVESRRLIRSLQPRLVHTTLFEANLVGRFASIGTAVPVAMSIVNTSYDPVRHHDPNITPWKLRLLQSIDGWTARHFVDRFHAITEAVKEAAIRDLKLNPAKITVIPRSRNRERLGEPSPQRRRMTRERLDLPTDAFVLLNVGRQEYQKGQKYLLEAMAQLRGDHPELVALIAGKEGNATGELRALHTNLALGDAVRFLGHRDDVGDLLAAADAFVFPSLYEGLGGALLESMAMGLPTVASDIPAIREVVGPLGGHLVQPAKVSCLVEATRVLVSDPAIRVQLRKEAFVRSELFDQRVIGQRMVSFLCALERTSK